MSQTESTEEATMSQASKLATGPDNYRALLEQGLSRLSKENVIQRIWQTPPDHTVWKPEPTEITNRLGWLRIADEMQDNLPGLHRLVDEVRQAGYTDVVLLGMGGSSLAPDVFRRTFPPADGYLGLSVLDSTVPGAVLSVENKLNLAQSLFVVATKSGGTVETFSLFKYFFNRVAERVGSEQAGNHFVAITDPGSGLADMASRLSFRATLLNNPDIGGRYSVLSYFGLAPAAFTGIDVKKLIMRAQAAGKLCSGAVQGNPAAVAGTFMGKHALAGRDKVTFIISPQIESFGDWVEQLIAESTGKEGKGILPVTGEKPINPAQYGNDRQFVYLKLTGDSTYDAHIAALEKFGHPVMTYLLNDVYDLGEQFFAWELATAVAGYWLEINPFDQPNVESAKVLARAVVAEYTEKGSLPQPEPVLVEQGIRAYTSLKAGSLNELTGDFLAKAKPGDYISIHAYLTPSIEITDLLSELQTALLVRTRLATTVGYGPRFLHSTGQLHKGDGGNGLFIQITTSPARDIPIPDEAGSSASSISFGVLAEAQAMGDRQALIDAGRRVLRLHLDDVPGGLQTLIRMITG